jgi:hypothetical protein
VLVEQAGGDELDCGGIDVADGEPASQRATVAVPLSAIAMVAVSGGRWPAGPG